MSSQLFKNIELLTIIMQAIIILYAYSKYLIIKKRKGNGAIVLTKKSIKILSALIILLNVILGICHIIRLSIYTYNYEP